MIVIWLDKSHSSKLFISLKQLISQFFFSVLFMCAMYREIQNNCSYYEGNSKEIFFNIGLCSQCCVYGLTRCTVLGMKFHLVLRLKDF